MKKAPEKSIFQKNKVFWEHGKMISQYDSKIAFFVKTYAVNQTFVSFKQNNSALKENEKKELEQMVRELADEKKTLGQDNKATVEEYSQFLENCFNNVDDEDRHGEVTIKTSASFKMLGELIDILTVFGEIPEAWNKKKKYCKFKALDIFKCLKSGVVPKRGGPKEEEDELNKQIEDTIIIDNNKNNIEQVNKQNNKENTHNDNNSNFKNNQQINEINPNFNNKPDYNINHHTDYDLNRNQNSLSIDFKQDCRSELNLIKNNSSMLGADYKLDSKLVKKLDFKIPVKYKSIDYFRLCDVINKQLESGYREMSSNKNDKALQYTELAYYYLLNVEK